MSSFIRPTVKQTLQLNRYFSASAHRPDLNKVQLIGRIGATPTRTEFEGGHVTNYTLATSEVKSDKEGNLIKRTQWHRITYWRTPEWFSKVKKGDLVYVEGSLRYSDYTDKDGNPKTKAEIHQTNFKLLNASRNEEED